MSSALIKPGVVEALAAVMEEVRGVGKDGFHDAPGAKFRFRGIDAVVNAVGPALRKHHVVVVPQLISVDHRDVLTSGGKPSRETCVVVKYVWTGPDGSTLDVVVPGEAMDGGDKGTAKAMSVAFRIALIQALCLPTDEADPDSQVYERATPDYSPPVGGSPTSSDSSYGANQTPDTVEDAKGALTAQVRALDLPVERVALAYVRLFDGEVGAETDPANIRKFTHLLASDTSGTLGETDPAAQ